MAERDSQYFVIAPEARSEWTMIDQDPDLPGGPWFDGQRIEMELDLPLRYSLDAMRPGDILPFYECAFPLMRRDLIGALQDAGVDNLQLFPALLDDPFAKQERTDFQAFNVIGVVSCADMEKAELMGSSTSSMIDVDFASMAIDPKRTGGALLFRLAEAVSTIIVHDSVRQHVQAAGIEGVAFYPPEQWAG